MRGARAGILLAMLLLAGLLTPPVGLAAQPLRQPPGPGAASESPLKRADEVPPDDVRAVLGWTGSGAGTNAGEYCHLGPDGRFEMTDYQGGTSAEVPCVVGVNDSLVPSIGDGLFARGWSREVPAEFEVRRPDGSVLPRVEDEFGEPSWLIGLGAPLGQYAITARQGPRSATGTFAVIGKGEWPISRVRPGRIWTDAPIGGTSVLLAGVPLQVSMAGFEPRQRVRLLLYRAEVFQTTLGSVETDGRGEATYTLASAADDPPGDYRVVTVPPSRGVAFGQHSGPSFCLIRTTADDLSETCIFDGSREWIAQATLFQANRTWAAAIARNGAPLADLECAFADRALAEATATAQGLRARGQYIAARLTGPILVHSTREMENGPRDYLRYEAVVTEQWDARLYNGDGSLAGVLPARLQVRYVIVDRYPERRNAEGPAAPVTCQSGRLVAEAELLRAE